MVTGLTVGELKKALDKYPDDAKVYVERIHDVYFEKHGWKPICKEDNIDMGFTHQYVQAWSPVAYTNEKDFFIDIHY